MSLSEVCVKRPVFAFMLISFLVTLGIFSFTDLGLDLFPRTDPATVNVAIKLPGASPEEMASQVVIPLEETISAISGIDEMRAYVLEGSAQVMITFVLEKDISEASEDVREKVSAAMRKLPPNVLPPSVTKSDPDSDPVITIAVSGQRSQRELTEIADKTLRRALETVDGVGGVDVYGGRNRQINIFLDINKLNAYNLSAQDVESAIRTENVETPGGRITRGPSELEVRTLGRVERVSEFGNIIVKNVGGAPVRVRDVGYAEDGMTERRSFGYFQGKPAVMMAIRRQVGANTVRVVDDVVAKLEKTKPTLPSGLEITVVKETATYIKNSVEALEEHLIIGSILASLIVFIFIRDWRTVFISALAIPTSVVATFTLLKWMGFTLNSMTLLGLTLAVGIVIDDAIIVLENIFRYIQEEGVEPIQAAIVATKEISLAVIATTFSLVIVFVPVAFMQGYAKKFLNQFGWTMSVSIMMSMLVAFTLTPALSARMLKRKVARAGEPQAGRGHHHSGFLERIYLAVLNWSLDHKWVIVTVCGITFFSTFYLNNHIGRDWMPQEDQAELSVFAELPEGSSLDLTEDTTIRMAKAVEKIPGVKAVIPSSSTFMDRVTMSSMTILLDPQDSREPIGRMGQKVRDVFRPYMFARPRVSFPNVLGGRDTFSPIRAMLLGPDMHKLVDLAREVNLELIKEPALSDLRVNLSLNNPEVQVNIDRPLASDLGVRVSDIASAVRLLMSGEDEISTFKEQSEQYRVTMRLIPGQRDDPAVLSRLLIPSAKQGLIRLDSVAKLERGLGPSRIDRMDRQYSVGIYANIAEGHSLGEGATAARAAIARVGLPPGYTTRFAGQVQVLEETTKNMILAIGLASIFMYMVLAAQFESLIHPFIILTTLPLSIPFALISLIVTGRSLNLFSALGVLLLLGIVKKNGILQIDYMNRLLAEGRELREAILEANRVRLRPILMTTFSIIAGLIPTAMGIGAGASQRSAIAITIIGGQSLCLLLSLVVVPVGYSMVEQSRAWLVSRRNAPAAAPLASSGD